jgi:hypothetical protein
MKEKMNLADQSQAHESSDDEQQLPHESPEKRKTAPESKGSDESSGGSQSNLGNNLPEDKEVHSDHD